MCTLTEKKKIGLALTFPLKVIVLSQQSFLKGSLHTALLKNTECSFSQNLNDTTEADAKVVMAYFKDKH